MNLHVANFQDIFSTYFQGTDAHNAAGVILRKIELGESAWLARSLRHHREDPITKSKEIAFRDGVDELIDCFNVVEVAAMAGLISVDAADPWFGETVFPILKDFHVRKYYKVNYPQRLPQMLLLRLEGKNLLVEPEAETLGLAFLDLDRRFNMDLGDSYLLALFDDFTIAGQYRFKDVIRLLEMPEKFMASLFKNEEDKDVPEQAAQELTLFIDFCFRLKELLEAGAKRKVLQAEIWLKYSYWFDILSKKLNRRLGQVLDRFVVWKPSSGGDQAVEEIQNYVLKARATLDFLFSQKYAGRVDALLDEHRK